MPITHRWDGTVLTITSDSGTSSADLKGQKGDDGARGPQGQAGSCVAEDTAKLGGIVADDYATKEYVNKKVSARNLLDNSDWRTGHFIAQAGILGLHGNTPYLGDRWRTYGFTSATLTDDGIICDTQDEALVLQIVNGVSGKTFTFAYTTNSTKEQKVSVYTPDLSTDIKVSWIYPNANGLVIMNVSIPNNIDEVAFIIYPENFKKYSNPVLYEGVYTAETLPPYIPKGYAVELAECRRYYKKEYVNCWLEWFWTNSLRVAVNYEKMRIDNPTIKLVNAKFINTNLNKWEQWIWINLMPYYTAQENQTPQSVLFVFTDNDNPFIEKMSYQGMIEYEINADL